MKERGIDRRTFLKRTASGLISGLAALTLPRSSLADIGPSLPGYYKGMTYASNYQDAYQTGDSLDSLTALAQTHAEAVSIRPVQYMDSVAAKTIHSTSDSPTDDHIISAIEDIQSKNMRVMISPQVELISPEGLEEVTYTSEVDWTTFFNSYTTFAVQYAELSRDHGVSLLSIGSEFGATMAREDNWRDVIQAVRETGYSGKLTFASNLDKVDEILWWNDLDVIGVNVYPELSSTGTPTPEDLENGWSYRTGIIEQVANTFGKKVLLTEIGFQSQNKTNTGTPDGTLDLQEQADCYLSAFQNFWDNPVIAGMFFHGWNTDPTHGGATDLGYSPKGKPAEIILKDWYAKERKTAVKNFSLYK